MSEVRVNLVCDASGAVEGARRGDVVVIVDVISLSTTLEAVLEGGAVAIFAASPDNANAPVILDPLSVGRLAGRKALELGTELVLIGEPRIGRDAERRANMTKALEGAIEGLNWDSGKSQDGMGSLVLPNVGADILQLKKFAGKVVLAVSASGGVAFDAALTAGAPMVTVATIARIPGKTGNETAAIGCRRAISLAQRLGTGITLVAASGNSLEDILGAQYIAKTILLSEFIGK